MNSRLLISLALAVLAVGLLAACEENGEKAQPPVQAPVKQEAADPSGDEANPPSNVKATNPPGEEAKRPAKKAPAKSNDGKVNLPSPVDPASPKEDKVSRPFRLTFTDPTIFHSDRIYLVGVEFTQKFKIERVEKVPRGLFDSRIIIETDRHLELLGSAKGQLQRVEGPLKPDKVTQRFAPKFHYRRALSTESRGFKVYEDTLVLKCIKPGDILNGKLVITLQTDDVSEGQFLTVVRESAPFLCIDDLSRMKDLEPSLLVLPPSKELLVGVPVPAKVVWEIGPRTYVPGMLADIVLSATGPLKPSKGLDFGFIDRNQPKLGLSIGLKQARGSLWFDLLCEDVGEGGLTAKIVLIDGDFVTTRVAYKCVAVAAGQSAPKLQIEPVAGDRFAGIPVKVKMTWDIPPVWLARDPSLLAVMIGPVKVTNSAGMRTVGDPKGLAKTIKAAQGSVTVELECTTGGGAVLGASIETLKGPRELASATANFRCLVTRAPIEISLNVQPPAGKIPLGIPLPGQIDWALAGLDPHPGLNMVVTATSPLRIDTGPKFTQSVGLDTNVSHHLDLDKISEATWLDIECDAAGEGALNVKIVTVDPATQKSTVHHSRTFTYQCVPSVVGLGPFQLKIKLSGGSQLVGIPFDVEVTWDVPSVWLPRKLVLVQQLQGPLGLIGDVGFGDFVREEKSFDAPVTAAQGSVKHQVQCIKAGEAKIIVSVRSPDTGRELVSSIATFRCDPTGPVLEDETPSNVTRFPGERPEFAQGRETVLGTYRKISGSCGILENLVPYPDQFIVEMVIEIYGDGLVFLTHPMGQSVWVMAL